MIRNARTAERNVKKMAYHSEDDTYTCDWCEGRNKRDETETEVAAMIYYVFEKYNMRKGRMNDLRRGAVFQECMENIKKHPELREELCDKQSLEFFVIQTIIYLIKI